MSKAFTLKTSHSELLDCAERKRSLKKDLADHCNSKEQARKRIVAFKNHLKKKAEEKQGNQHESDSDEDSDTEEIFDSQQSLIKNIIRVGDRIKEIEKDIKSIE